MQIQLELWHLILILMSLVGACWAGAQFFFVQFEKRMLEKFDSNASQAHSAYERLEKIVSQQQVNEGRTVEMITSLERDFLMMRAELPNIYVRREDFIRNQTVIEAKLDRITSKIELIQVKGNPV